MKTYKEILSEAKSPMQIGNAFIKIAKGLKPGKLTKIGMSKTNKHLYIKSVPESKLKELFAKIGLKPDPGFNWSYYQKDKFQGAYSNNDGVNVLVGKPTKTVSGEQIVLWFIKSELSESADYKEWVKTWRPVLPGEDPKKVWARRQKNIAKMQKTLDARKVSVRPKNAPAKSTDADFKEFAKLMKQPLDRSFEYSDDAKVYQKGKAQLNKIFNAYNRLNGDHKAKAKALMKKARFSVK